MYISPLFFYIHVAGTGRSGVFITARAEWKPVGVETLSRATPKFHLKRKIRKNHSTGMKSIFFSPWGLFPYFIAILGEKRDKVGRLSDAAYLCRSQSSASSRVCKLRKLRSKGCPERLANRRHTVVWRGTFSDRWTS